MLSYLQMIETPQQRSDFEKIYLTYRGLMFHIANNILQNDEDAEDAVHNAFVAIAENIQKIEEPVCPKTKG
jgi:RNA polymerase sigma-70 factor (ECF subfamily)